MAHSWYLHYALTLPSLNPSGSLSFTKQMQISQSTCQISEIAVSYLLPFHRPLTTHVTQAILKSSKKPLLNPDEEDTKNL